VNVLSTAKRFCLGTLYSKIIEQNGIFFVLHLHFSPPFALSISRCCYRFSPHEMAPTVDPTHAEVPKKSGLVVQIESALSDGEPPANLKAKKTENEDAFYARTSDHGETEKQTITVVSESTVQSSKMVPQNETQPAPVKDTEVKDTERCDRAEFRSTTPDLVPEPTSDEPKKSAWARIRETLAHDPLNDLEFVEAYNDWRKRNRKERYDRRKAWVLAHGCRLGRLLRLVDQEKAKEAWTAYQKKLSYMED
jgi:hypothetical protein